MVYDDLNALTNNYDLIHRNIKQLIFLSQIVFNQNGSDQGDVKIQRQQIHQQLYHQHQQQHQIQHKQVQQQQYQQQFKQVQQQHQQQRFESRQQSHQRQQQQLQQQHQNGHRRAPSNESLSEIDQQIVTIQNEFEAELDNLIDEYRLSTQQAKKKGDLTTGARPFSGLFFLSFVFLTVHRCSLKLTKD